MAQRFIGYFAEYLRLRLDETAEAAHKVHETMSAVEADFSRRVREIAHHMTEDDRIEFYNQSADEQMMISSADQFTRRALFVSAYSQFEDSLKQLCRFVVKLGLSRETVPRKGFYFATARKLLTGIVVGQNKFDTAAFAGPWDEIDIGWREIRNNLVHDAGVVELDQRVTVPADDASQPPLSGPVEEVVSAGKIKNFIESRCDMRLEFGELSFDAGVTESFVQVAKKTIDDLIQEIQRIAPASPPEPYRRPR
jgi:hypothetical protein